MIAYPEEVKLNGIRRAVKMLRLYDFECQCCGEKIEKVVRVLGGGTECEPVTCRNCGSKMDRLFAMFRINMGPVPLVGYYDDTLGTYIRTNRHRKEVMREQGVSEKGATPKAGAIA